MKKWIVQWIIWKACTRTLGFYLPFVSEGEASIVMSSSLCKPPQYGGTVRRGSSGLR